MCENCALVIWQANFLANILLELCGGVQITVDLHTDRLLSWQSHANSHVSFFCELSAILYGSAFGFVGVGPPIVRSLNL